MFKHREVLRWDSSFESGSGHKKFKRGGFKFRFLVFFQFNTFNETQSLTLIFFQEDLKKCFWMIFVSIFEKFLWNKKKITSKVSFGQTFFKFSSAIVNI